MTVHVMMCRSTPRCPWEGARILTSVEQRRVANRTATARITGFNSRDSKANFIAWLAQSEHEYAWHLEDDVYAPGLRVIEYEGTADLVGMPLQRQVGGWVERTCSICNRTNVVKIAWPALRMSRGKETTLNIYRPT